jgi:hypothetical protein
VHIAGGVHLRIVDIEVGGLYTGQLCVEWAEALAGALQGKARG